MNQDNNDAKSGRPRDGNDTESSTMSGKTHEAAESVRQAALERVQSARESADSAKQQAAERVRKLGAAVRKIGEHMLVEDQSYIAGRATNASQRLDDLASYIDSAELSTLVRDTEDIARRKPLVFFGGAFLAGLAAGRFLKVSGSGGQPRPSSQGSRSPRAETRGTGSLASRSGESTASAGGAGSAAAHRSVESTPSAGRRLQPDRGARQ